MPETKIFYDEVVQDADKVRACTKSEHRKELKPPKRVPNQRAIHGYDICIANVKVKPSFVTGIGITKMYGKSSVRCQCPRHRETMDTH